MTGAIVCGVDGSPDSLAALQVAAQLSGQLDTALVVAYVARPPSLFAPSPVGAGARSAAPPALVDAELRAGERLLEDLTKEEGLRDVARRVVAGLDAADRLADLADDEGAELIVVGSRGRGAFKAAFLGSVSNALIGVARCPVVIVPPGAAEEHERHRRA
jgi:nucleotide-binding universal stress UspA family protein